MANKRYVLSTPVAILLAGGLIALGLYIGVRERTSRLAAAAQPVVGAPPQPARPQLQPPRRSRPSRTTTAARLKEAVAALRPTMREKCWLPVTKDASAPLHWSATFTFSFDAAGKQLSRGVRERRSSSPVAIANCVGALLPPFSLGADAAGLSNVAVDITFP